MYVWFTHEFQVRNLDPCSHFSNPLEQLQQTSLSLFLKGFIYILICLLIYLFTWQRRKRERAQAGVMVGRGKERSRLPTEQQAQCET